MLKTLIITNLNNGKSLSIELARPEKSGLAVLSIDGMGPVDSNANITQFATRDGGYYVSSRMPSRSITLSMAILHPIEENRRNCYSLLSVKAPVQLDFIFESGIRNATIQGYVESNQPEIFSNFEQTSVSITCPDPYFKDYGSTGTVDPFFESHDKFEFEFECAPIDIGETITYGVEFGEYINTNRKIVHCNSEYSVGVSLVLKIIYPVDSSSEITDNITVVNHTNGSQILLNKDSYTSIVGHAPAYGDIVVVNTRKGEKAAVAQNELVTLSYNILDAVIESGNWLYLSPGDNDIEISFGNDTIHEYELSIVYDNVYAGL